MKKVKFIICLCVIILIASIFILVTKEQKEVKSVKSDKELLAIYNNNNKKEVPFYIKLLTMPFSIFSIENSSERNWNTSWGATDGTNKTTNDIVPEYSDSTNSRSSKDYSKTNIQVEGVDEADIIKTDGNYIYSLSNQDVVITNVEDPSNTKVVYKIHESKTTPTELLLYNDKLVVISTEIINTTSPTYYWYRKREANTVVSIYNISNKEMPKLEKSFKLNEEYKTIRCIDGKLYVFSTGKLRKKENKIERKYLEDNKVREIDLNNIKYLNDNKDNVQTLIAELDLNKVKEDIKVSSYLIDISNAYISKENIYLINGYYYEGDYKPKIKDLFGFGGIIGFFKKNIEESNNIEYGLKTQIYKFRIDNKAGVVYHANTSVEGNIINHYSLDEHNDYLRLALYTNEGSFFEVLDKDLKSIGKTEKVAEGERMYASRFMGDRAYLVTYKNTDPLFVVDLSNPQSPEILGELKIPGYSTYLHPYDENHLIGIGMETKETVNRGYDGRIISTWTETVGMKMSLFDVTDVNNPVEIDHTTIGDRRTVSAILTNPKALLFSKEKELLAIPVNNYNEDFSSKSSDEYDEEIDKFTSKSNYVSEGYLVYKINLEGFKLRGSIVHSKKDKENNSYYSNNRLLRGVYIEDKLYTVSEDTIKVNELSDLKEIKSLDLKGEK